MDDLDLFAKLMKAKLDFSLQMLLERLTQMSQQFEVAVRLS